MNMKFEPLSIPDVVLIQAQSFLDHRGAFREMYRKNIFAENGIKPEFVQDNISESNLGVLRGLHYQVNRPQGKLVRVLTGKIFDVAVDLRRSSPTFGKWVGVTLLAEENQQLWIPPKFAHGFYAMSEKAIIEYKCTSYYDPQSDRTILWNDSDINIEWPLINDKAPILSEKDENGKLFNMAEVFE